MEEKRTRHQADHEPDEHNNPKETNKMGCKQKNGGGEEDGKNR